MPVYDTRGGSSGGGGTARPAPPPSAGPTYDVRGGPSAPLGAIGPGAAAPSSGKIFGADPGFLGSPLGWALEKSGIPYVQAVGRVLESVGASPLEALFHPGSVVQQGMGMIRGIGQLGYQFSPANIAYETLIQHKSMNDVGKQLGDFGTAMLSSTAKDYANRYGPNWRQYAAPESLSTLLDATAVLGFGARAAATAGAAGRLADAGLLTADSPLANVRNLWQEANRPGLVSEGAVRPRAIEYTTPEGTVNRALQEYSASPLRRYFQQALDQYSMDNPDANLFGAATRVNRAKAAQLSRAYDRLLAVPDNASAINDLSPEQRTRLFWGSKLGDSSSTALQRLHDWLSGEYAKTPEELAGVNAEGVPLDPEFHNFIQAARRQGFGPLVLKNLNDAISVAKANEAKFPETGMSPKYEKALGAMQDTTKLVEQVIRDNEGFSSLKNDLGRAYDKLQMLPVDSPEAEALHEHIGIMEQQLKEKGPQLEAMFASSRSRLSQALGDSELRTSPVRQARYQEFAQKLGIDQANHLTNLIDTRAWAARPADPASYWADAIGAPQGEGAAEFVGRDVAAQYQQLMTTPTRDWGPGEQAVFESGATPNPNDLYYSPLQRSVDQLPERAQAGQMQAVVRKAIPEENYRNANLDNFFGQFDRNQVITKAEFQEFLANPTNTYGIREVHLVNTPEAEQVGMGTKYDYLEQMGTYVSRDPALGEYHEVVLEMPAHPESYSGTGYGHWGRDNVAVHFRFHDFEEGGVHKLLIEEIQSDWVSDFRRNANKLPSPELTDEEANRFDYHAGFHESYSAMRQGAVQALSRAKAEINRLEMQTGEYLTPAERQQQLASHVADVEEAERELKHHLGAMTELNKGKVPAYPYPPLGRGLGARSSYANSAIRWLTRYATENGVNEIVLIPRETQLVRNASGPWTREAGNWAEHAGGDAEDVTKFMEDNPQLMGGRSYQMYNEDIPRLLNAEMGAEGQLVRDAYSGHYRSGLDLEEQAAGQMPGWTWEMTPEAEANALEPRSLYQRQPDWNALPKGATELLANGNTLMHLFEGADASTVVHELAHISLHDLSAEDFNVIAAHYAEGRPIEAWTNMMHENYARAFESYARDGIAPTPELVPAFKAIAQWITAIWRREGTNVPSVTPEVRQVFDQLFVRREPDIFIPDRAYRANVTGARGTKGIPRAARAIGDLTQPREPLFKRNRLALVRSGMIDADPRHLVEHMSRMVMLARANQLREAIAELGVPFRPGVDLWDPETQYVMKKTGRGIDKPLFDSLEASDNPISVQNAIRDNLNSHFAGNEDELQQLATQAWKSREQLYLVDRQTTDSLFKHATGRTPGATTTPLTTGQRIWDAALNSARAMLLYANPGFYVANIVGNLAMQLLSDPRSLRDLPWSFQQAIKSVYREDAGDPFWHRIATEAGRGPTAGAVTGRPTIFGERKPGIRGVYNMLSDRPPGTAGRVAEMITHGWGNVGRRAGRFVDDSFRVAVWKQVARKRGITTDAQMQRLIDDAAGITRTGEGLKTRPGVGRGLLDTEYKQGRYAHLSRYERRVVRRQLDAKRTLNSIRDETEQLMLDFDSMTPFERTYLTRTVFLYPFLKASTKWPFLYAGERPITGALTGAAGLAADRATPTLYGPRPGLPSWMEGYTQTPMGYWPVGSVAPIQAGLQILDSISRLGQKPVFGTQRPTDYLMPLVQLGLDLGQGQTKFGKASGPVKILQGDLPLPTLARPYVPYVGHTPSNIYAQHDFLHNLIRAFRGPFRVDAATAAQQQARYGGH